MKKLASLIALSALGLFAVGCNETADNGPDPVPADSSSDTGISGEGGSELTNEGGAVDDAPPVTNDAPPVLPAPEGGDAAAPAGNDATSTEDATANESATEAAAGSDTAEPAAESEQPAPQ